MLCKGNPKIAPSIKPILFTQVHYHLHQRSYLHHRPQTPDRTHMVDHAEYIIGVFDNQKKLRSGTAQTVNYALRNGKAITLIHPDTMEITTPTT